jgi:hypothetical protein
MRIFSDRVRYLLSKTGKFSTYYVPDQGIWYTPGETVRLDETRSSIQIVKDPAGEYEVHSCRQATEYTGGPALLRVGLRRGLTQLEAAPRSAGPYAV